MTRFLFTCLFLFALLLESLGFGTSLGGIPWLPLWTGFLLALSFEASFTTLLTSLTVALTWLFLAHPMDKVTTLWLAGMVLVSWFCFRGIVAHRSFLGTLTLLFFGRCVFFLLCYVLYWRGIAFEPHAFFRWVGLLFATDLLTFFVGFYFLKRSYVAR